MKCTVCGQLYKLVDGSTTGARSHIIRKHPELIPALDWKKKKVPVGHTIKRLRSSISSATQQALGTMVVRKRKTTDPRVTRVKSTGSVYKMMLPSNSSDPTVDLPGRQRLDYSREAEADAAGTKSNASDLKANAVTGKILNMILSQGLPFSFVEQPSFKELLEELAPSYTIPNRKEFLTTHINTAVHKVLHQTREHIQANSSLAFAFTTDIWRSKQGDSYIDIHMFYIDKDFKRVHCKLLGIIEFPDDISAAENLQKFLQLLDVFGINAADHKLFLTCNTENVVPNMWEESRFNKIECIGHSLNSMVQRALYSVPEVSRAFDCGSSIVNHISGVVKKIMKDEISQFPQLLQLLHHGATQWNSYLFQEEWLQKLQPTIDVMTLEQVDIPTRTSEESIIAQQSVEIMRPLEQMTKEMNGHHYPSLSMRIPLLEKAKREIQLALEKNSQYHEKSLEFGRELLNTINFYMSEQENKYTGTEKWSQAATSLDPRFKTILFDAATIKQTKVTLTDLHSKIQILLTPKDDDSIAEAIPITCLDSEWGFLEERKSEPGSPQNNHAPDTAFDEELKLFWAGEWIGIDQCPLQWWRKHKVRFPFLAELARILLALPAASMASDHLQSPIGNVAVPKHASMDPSIKRNMLFARAALCASKDGIQSSRNFPHLGYDENDDPDLS